MFFPFFQSQTMRSYLRKIISTLQSAEEMLFDILITNHRGNDTDLEIRTTFGDITLTTLHQEYTKILLPGGLTAHTIDNIIIPEATLQQHKAATVKVRMCLLSGYIIHLVHTMT